MTSKVLDNCTSFQMDALRLSLFAVELSMNTVVIFLSVLLAILLSRTNTLDRNPKVLLANHQFASFNIAWTRFILIPQMLFPNGLFNPLMITPIQWFHDISINVNTFIQYAITIECFFSTFYPFQWEEFTSHFWVAILTFIWPWIFTALLHFSEQNHYIETIPEFIGLLLLNIICSIIFCFLYVINRRKYKKFKAGDLAGKYRVIVNIKIVRTLNFVSALSVIRNFVTMSLLLLIILYFKPLCDYYAYLISSHSYDLAVSFYNLLHIVPFVLTHKEFAKLFRSFLVTHFKSVLNYNGGGNGTSALNVQTIKNVAKNALGEDIILANNSDEHFQRLAKTWETRRPHTTTQQIRTGPFGHVWSAGKNPKGSRKMVEVEIPPAGMHPN